MENLSAGIDCLGNVQEERVQCLWKALERVIPDIRERTELALIGTPLTHERYLNRHRGTYGPAISAANGSFPGPGTDIPGLYRCAPGHLCPTHGPKTLHSLLIQIPTHPSPFSRHC